ncbi:hypothetical protein AVM71_16255 (plasmid) [Piscirickettsia salmonis]|nr:hypothetical protein AVM71_16255 [Piscirickettsia salmonis]
MAKLISLSDYANSKGMTRQAIAKRISQGKENSVSVNGRPFIKVKTVPEDVDSLPINKEFMSIQKAASYIGSGKTFIRVAVKSGEIKSYRIGG